MDVAEMFDQWGRDFEELLSTNNTPLTQEASLGLLQCFMLEKDNKPVPSDLLAQPGVQISLKRAEFIKLKLNPWVAVMLAICFNSPGEIVMMLYYMKWKSIQQKYTQITMNEFSLIFPFGFLDDESSMKIWDKQKVPSSVYGTDNMLDALRFEEVQ